jgi:hypothetical protein
MCFKTCASIHPDPRNSHAPFHSQALGFFLCWLLLPDFNLGCVYIHRFASADEAFVVRLLSLYVANNKNGYDGSVGVLPFASKAFFGGNSYTFKRKKEKKKLIFFCAGQWL